MDIPRIAPILKKNLQKYKLENMKITKQQKEKWNEFQEGKFLKEHEERKKNLDRVKLIDKNLTPLWSELQKTRKYISKNKLYVNHVLNHILYRNISKRQEQNKNALYPLSDQGIVDLIVACLVQNMRQNHHPNALYTSAIEKFYPFLKSLSLSKEYELAVLDKLEKIHEQSKQQFSSAIEAQTREMTAARIKRKYQDMIGRDNEFKLKFPELVRCLIRSLCVDNEFLDDYDGELDDSALKLRDIWEEVKVDEEPDDADDNCDYISKKWDQISISKEFKTALENLREDSFAQVLEKYSAPEFGENCTITDMEILTGILESIIAVFRKIKNIKE